MEYIKRNIIIIPVVVLFCSGMILLGIYPYRPSSILSWVALFLLTFPIVIVLEFIGTKLFGIKHVSKLSRPAGIFFGVIALIVVMVALSIILFSAEQFLGKWGT